MHSVYSILASAAYRTLKKTESGRDYMGKRFLGELEFVTPAFGFLKNVRTSSGNGKHPDVFVRVSEAKNTLGRGKNILKQYHGSTFSFVLQPSELHQGKVEASMLMDIQHKTYML